MDGKFLNNHNIATVILNPAPPLNENYLWIPEVSGNVAPGLDSMITYAQPTYATLAALQNAITTVNNNIQTETNDLGIPTQRNLNVSNELYYNTTLTYYTFQRNNTIHNDANRRTCSIQNHFFTYQRTGHQELRMQALSHIAADFQSQINNITHIQWRWRK